MELEDVIFENPFTNELRGDELLTNTRRQVHNAYYSRFSYSTAAPKTLAVSEEVRLLLGITSDAADSTEFAEIFSGNAVTTIWNHMQCAMGGINLGIGPGN